MQEKMRKVRWVLRAFYNLGFIDSASVHAGASLGSKRGRLNHHEVTAHTGKRARSDPARELE